MFIIISTQIQNIISAILGSGLFTALVTFIADRISEHNKSISASPSKVNTVGTILAWLFIAAFLVILFSFIPLITVILSSKFFGGKLLLIVIAIVIASLGYILYLLWTTIAKTNYVVPNKDFKYATFTAALPNGVLIKLWIIKELNNGNLLCVSGLKEYKDEQYIYIPKEQLHFKKIVYTFISDD